MVNDKSRERSRTMEFIAAGEVLGSAHQVPLLRISHSPLLPDGEYSFIDMYCSDPGYDCRKTMFQVMHEGRLVSTINYGWEAAEFYEQWMGADVEDGLFPSMKGVSIDMSSPNLVSQEGILGLFQALLNDMWIAKFKRHYKETKTVLSNQSR